MTDCAHNDKSKYVDCAQELLEARKELMRLRTENAEIMQLVVSMEDVAAKFDQFLNEPPSYENERMVRGYRHEAYKEWKHLSLIILQAAKRQAVPR